jgi:hypothetical protein
MSTLCSISHLIRTGFNLGPFGFGSPFAITLFWICFSINSRFFGIFNIFYNFFEILRLSSQQLPPPLSLRHQLVPHHGIHRLSGSSVGSHEGPSMLLVIRELCLLSITSIILLCTNVFPEATDLPSRIIRKPPWLTSLSNLHSPILSTPCVATICSIQFWHKRLPCAVTELTVHY